MQVKKYTITQNHLKHIINCSTRWFKKAIWNDSQLFFVFRHLVMIRPNLCQDPPPPDHSQTNINFHAYEGFSGSSQLRGLCPEDVLKQVSSETPYPQPRRNCFVWLWRLFSNVPVSEPKRYLARYNARTPCDNVWLCLVCMGKFQDGMLNIFFLHMHPMVGSRGPE